MRIRWSLALASFILAAVLAACGGASPATTPATSAPAATVAPAATEAPGSTEAPPATSLPATAAPAATEAPTATQEAAATQPPTTAPEPTVAPAPTEAPTTAPAPAADTGPTGQGAYDLLLEVAKAQLSQKAYRVTMVSKDESGKESTTVLEAIPPKSFHMKNAAGDFVVVPEGTFTRRGTGKWEKSPMDMGPMISEALSQQGIEEQLKDLKPDDIQFVGADLIGGKPMWIYQYKSSMDLGTQALKAQTKLWVGALDKLPYRAETQGTMGTTKIDSTATYEYDPSIKIEAPKAGS